MILICPPPHSGWRMLEFSIPAVPSLIGVVLHFQGAIVNNAAHELHLTGYTADAIGR